MVSWVQIPFPLFLLKIGTNFIKTMQLYRNLNLFAYILIGSASIGAYSNRNIPIVFWIAMGVIGGILAISKFLYLNRQKRSYLFFIFSDLLFITAFNYVVYLLPNTLGILKSIIGAILFVGYIVCVFRRLKWW